MERNLRKWCLTWTFAPFPGARSVRNTRRTQKSLPRHLSAACGACVSPVPAWDAGDEVGRLHQAIFLTMGKRRRSRAHPLPGRPRANGPAPGSASSLGLPTPWLQMTDFQVGKVPPLSCPHSPPEVCKALGTTWKERRPPLCVQTGERIVTSETPNYCSPRSHGRTGPAFSAPPGSLSSLWGAQAKLG